MRAATIAYLPSQSDSRFHTSCFVQNLAENRPAGELILFSDHDQPLAKDAGFNVIRLKGTVEVESLKKAKIQRPQSGELVENRAAINNLIFLTALRICETHGVTHFLYLEEDCRVKNLGGRGVQGEPATGTASQVVTPYESATQKPLTAFDAILFDEFFRQPRHLIMAGSVVVYNAANFNLENLQRYERFLKDTEAVGRKLPIPPYGWLPAPSSQGSLVFVNGAGGCYSVAGLKMLYPEREKVSDIELAPKIWSWDFDMGLRAWTAFQSDVWNLIGYLPSVCSHYGNVLSTPAERLQWLNDERFCCVHQIKGDL